MHGRLSDPGMMDRGYEVSVKANLQSREITTAR